MHEQHRGRTRDLADLESDALTHRENREQETVIKALTLILLAVAGSGSAAVAQDAAPPAIVTHRIVRTQTITHNDGGKHQQIAHVRHRTILRTPEGTMVRTTTSTTNTPPK